MRGKRPQGDFRPDIQGLRAVAVLLVALDHANVPHLAGGFVGVDVFFVISGFLITGWLLRRTAEANSVPILEFYGARARRILPAATLAITAIVVASYHYLNYVRALAVMWDAVWAACFAANVRFSQVGTDYFATDNPPSPLQHFWTLAVEEQFYLVWPALLVVLVFVFRSRPPRGRRVVDSATIRRVGIVLAVCVAASLFWSVRTTPNDPTGAYFSTLARAWELGTGALVAFCVSPLTRIPGWLRSVMTWVGLGGVLLAAVTFTPQTQFPGYAAVLPVGSAALIIIGGLGAARDWSAGSLLGHQPFRLIGDVSYGFYLWHWPFLIIPMEYQGHALSLTTNLELLLLAFAVSVVTYWLVENPIRHSRTLLAERPRSLILWPISLLITLLASAYYIGVIHDRLAVQATGTAPKDLTNAALVRAVGASVATSRLESKVGIRLSPSPGALRQDWFPVGSCVIPVGPQTSEQLCRWGDSTAQRTVVLFGDSHAHMWLAGVTRFASTRTYRLVPLIKDRCVASAWAGFKQTAACRAWDAWALGVIRRIKPAAVILGTSYFLKGSTTEHNAQIAGLSAEISALSAVTGTVVLLQDPPRLPIHPVDCLLAHGATYGSCTYPLDSTETEFYARTYDAATQAGAAVVPTLQWFCSNNECPTVVGHTIAYLDTNHVSNTYATEVARALAIELARSIGT